MHLRLAFVVAALVTVAIPAHATILYRVNAGGPTIAAADSSLPDWEGDTTFTPAILVGGDMNIYAPGGLTIDMTDPSLTPAVPAGVFETERWDGGAAGDALVDEMRWEFAISAGTTVEVRLFVAETFGGLSIPPGRQFNVAVEGVVPAAFSGIDPYADAGNVSFKGTMVSTTVMVGLDGVLNLDFLHVTENPAIKAIEIVAVPEPTTAGLFALGVVALAARRRQRI